MIMFMQKGTLETSVLLHFNGVLFKHRVQLQSLLGISVTDIHALAL
jgi:hypothetical protein